MTLETGLRACRVDIISTSGTIHRGKTDHGCLSHKHASNIWVKSWSVLSVTRMLPETGNPTLSLRNLYPDYFTDIVAIPGSVISESIFRNPIRFSQRNRQRHRHAQLPHWDWLQ